MKFSSHLDHLEKNLSVMKFCAVSSAFVALGVAVMLGIELSKPPLLIERGLGTQTVELKGDERLATEVQEFLRSAILQRFNSQGLLKESFFSEEQTRAKLIEQKSLATQNMKQNILIEEISIKDNEALVQADRIIRLDEARSAAKMNLKIQFFTVPRTTENPYGLKITAIEDLK